MIISILREYGFRWAFNRLMYTIKVKSMQRFPFTDKLYEKRVPMVQRIDMFDIDADALRESLSELNQSEKDKIISEADDAIRGVVNAFSSVKLDYGYPINWQLNPLTNKYEDNRKKWYMVKDFDVERGDIKAIWEISRFSHFIVFARAYLLTGNVKYYEAFSQQLDSWIKENKYGYGANYKCSQECSIRMVNAMMAFTVFSQDLLVTENDIENIKVLIHNTYRKILSNFFYAYKCIKNNHTLSELMGMIVGAWCCEDYRRLKKAYKYLDKVICEQFFEDGGYIQYSFNYQRFALQVIDRVISISHKTGFDISDSAKARVRKSAELMYQCQTTDGDVPNYGSNDGAVVFPISSCGYRDFRPVINSTLVLLDKSSSYLSGKYEEELVWYGKSRKNTMKYDIIPRKMCSYDNAGLFTIRKDNIFAMVVCNKYNSRPGHMDQLHLDVWIDNINLLCDQGTYSYASDLGVQLIGNSSHNTVNVCNASQMNIKPPFLIYDWSRRLDARLSGNVFEGTVQSKNGYTHSRRVEITDNKIILLDTVYGNKKSDISKYEILFHTVCTPVKEEAGIALYYGKKKLAIFSTDGECDIENSDRSLYYMQKEKIACIKVAAAYEKTVQTEIYMEA